jgi:hypothetical protein
LRPQPPAFNDSFRSKTTGSTSRALASILLRRFARDFPSSHQQTQRCFRGKNSSIPCARDAKVFTAEPSSTALESPRPPRPPCDAHLFTWFSHVRPSVHSGPIVHRPPIPTVATVTSVRCSPLYVVLARDTKTFTTDLSSTALPSPPWPLSPTMSLRSRRPVAWLRPRSRARFSRCDRLFPSTRPTLCPALLFSRGQIGPNCREPSSRPTPS